MSGKRSASKSRHSLPPVITIASGAIVPSLRRARIVGPHLFTRLLSVSRLKNVRISTRGETSHSWELRLNPCHLPVHLADESDQPGLLVHKWCALVSDGFAIGDEPGIGLAAFVPKRIGQSQPLQL